MSVPCNCRRVPDAGCHCMNDSGTDGAEELTFLQQGRGWLVPGPCCLLFDVGHCCEVQGWWIWQDQRGPPWACRAASAGAAPLHTAGRTTETLLDVLRD